MSLERQAWSRLALLSSAPYPLDNMILGPSFPMRAFRPIGVACAASFALAGCVVTTYEGVHEPPNTPVALQADLEPVNPGPAVIAASHLLIQYQGARAADHQITRSKDQAKERVAQALEQAQAGVDFEKLVVEYSDEPGAAARGGKLGRFSREQMVPEFSDAAFELEVGQVSGVVETPYGFHVIMRDE